MPTDEEVKPHLDGLTVTESAMNLIKTSNNPSMLSKEVAELYKSRALVTETDVMAAIEMDEKFWLEYDRKTNFRGNNVEVVSPNTIDKSEEVEELNKNPFSVLDHSVPESTERSTEYRRIEVSGDITGKSESTGGIEDFKRYFRSRYEKITSILDSRLETRTVSSIGRGSMDNEVTLTVSGMVREKRTTRSNNILLVIEDVSGKIPVVFSDDELIEVCKEVFEDEVIAVEGNLFGDGEILSGDRIHFPDIPPLYEPNEAERSVKVAMISDIHFGAKEFAADKWLEFVDWIHAREDIEYLLVAGDVIEGVGIYSGQEEQISVSTLTEQYELFEKGIGLLPQDLDIVISTGNHDCVRLAEPQPSLQEDLGEFVGENVTFVGNPARVNIEGVRFLMYHGVSLNPVIEKVPDGDIQAPASAMKYLLRKRHLVPMYGDGVRIAPEKEDYLAIEEIPDVLHSGHLHTFDLDDYNGVKMVNTGTWQHQTDFQRERDVDPDVGYCCVVDLADGSTQIYSF